jgi:amino acid transporter
VTIREHFSWVWLAAMVLTYGPYFAIIAVLKSHGEIPHMTEVALLSGAALVQVIMLAMGSILVRMRDPSVRRKPDERDQAIKHRAAATSYYVLMAGTIVVGCVMPFLSTGWDLVHAAVLAIVIAEIVDCVLVVRAYKSGWHP